jgi:hypothetical protein
MLNIRSILNMRKLTFGRYGTFDGSRVAKDITRDKMFAAALSHVMHGSLDCRIRVDPSVAARTIRIFGGYNEMTIEGFVRLLREIDRIVGRMSYQSDNPNNGFIGYKIDIGREGSPVLYVELGEYDWRTSQPKPFSEPVQRELYAAARRALADEIDFINEGRTLRIWWD